MRTWCFQRRNVFGEKICIESGNISRPGEAVGAVMIVRHWMKTYHGCLLEQTVRSGRNAAGFSRLKGLYGSVDKIQSQE